MKIPEQGMSPQQVMEQLQQARSGDADWRSGRTWSLVYWAGEEHTELLKRAYSACFSENGLSPLAFPSLKRFETEVLAMAADMLGGGPDSCGSLTSGGTESILMAVKSARQWARAERPHVTSPELLLPITAHPAFEKAAHYLGVKPVHVPVGKDFRADVAAARELLSDNTILVVGSAPSFPQGVVDPIEELAALAAGHGLPCHVDACLGGFLLPWLRELGREIPPFDFSVPGVTSISADIHKYGFAAKGASCILYRDEQLRRHQYFAYSNWPGGIYVSPTMTGTRPGGAIAAAWACLQHLGREGYLDLARRIMDLSDRLRKGIAAIEGLYIFGQPVASVFGFGLEEGNVYLLGELMERRGWHLDRLQDPPGLHLMVTPVHEPVVQPFLDDLAECTRQAREQADESLSGMAAVYGMMATIDDRSQADAMAIEFLSQLMKPEA